ncbi:MAG: HlyC/CorC family transporter [Planctomycetes bacterium]|nr:HlyC/CorC family transporter [Planctomycetota bacterium]
MIIWIGLVVLLALLLFSTLNLALHVPSRTRLAEEFERTRRSELFESFVIVRPQYMLATAVLRAACTLLLLLIVLWELEAFGANDSRFPTIASFAIALALVLVFGVAIPNAWSKYCGEWLVVRVLPLLRGVRILCYPITVVLAVFDPVVRRLAGVPVLDAKSYAEELEREILHAVSEGERHGAVDEEEKEMIESVIELTDTNVEEIMTPRTDIVAIPKDIDLEGVLQIIRERGHSRIPVYDDTIDSILGVLYAKDLLTKKPDEGLEVTSMMRKALFVPESKPVREMLREFQARKVHIAIVLDEYGGTAGMVTIEDILEELVGEIEDEYEETAPAELKRIDDQTVEVDARMRIDDLNDQLDIQLPEDEHYETIGGFVFSTLGKVPEIGEHCEHNQIGIRVIAAEARRILRVQLKIGKTVDDKGSDDS